MSENMCDLCNPHTIDQLYYEDDHIHIFDCMSCQVPMVVLKRHTSEPKEDEDFYMEKKLQEIMKECYPDQEYIITKNARSIPDHAHYHARIQK